MNRLILITLAMLTSSAGMPCSAQRLTESESADATNECADRLSKLFLEQAESLEIQPADGTKKFELVRTPLFRFATEGTVFGSVFVWQDSDSRLSLNGTIGSLPINGTDMQFLELHLLKPERISPLTVPGYPTKTWDPNIDELQLRSIDGAPTVAENARMRLTQMRSLARQFTAQMIHDGQTNQLRLLPHPLYRYADSTSVRDGALFAFVWDNGTDPELILRIEATLQDGAAHWRYQPIRFTWRSLKLQHQQHEVWRVAEFFDRDSPSQKTPYLTGLTGLVP